IPQVSLDISAPAGRGLGRSRLFEPVCAPPRPTNVRPPRAASEQGAGKSLPSKKKPPPPDSTAALRVLSDNSRFDRHRSAPSTPRCRPQAARPDVPIRAGLLYSTTRAYRAALGTETALQDPRDMEGRAPSAVGDLVATRGAVGDDQRIGSGLADSWKQRQL